VPDEDPRLRLDKRGRRIGRNWWREYITDMLSCADHAWWLDREAHCVGYATEEAEYQELHPRPTLKDFLIRNRGMHNEDTHSVIHCGQDVSSSETTFLETA